MRILKNGTFENLFKIADVRFQPDELARMRGEGYHAVTDTEVAEPNVMQDVDNRKNDIKGLVGKLALPRIMYPSENNIVELDGHQYYVIHVAEPQPRKNPEGTVYLLDVQTGEPTNRPFLQVADRLRSVRRENIRKSVEELNALIAKWNSRIGKIESVVSPTTWPLQLVWATEAVDERIEELGRQEQALVARLDSSTNFSPSWASTIERLKTDLAAGRIPQPDMIETIMTVQNSDPDAIDQILELPSIPDDIKEHIKLLVGMRNESIEQKKRKREMEEQSRKDRFEAPPTEQDFGGMLNPGDPGIVGLEEKNLDDLAGKKPKVPDRYFSPQGRVQQIRASLAGIRKDKAELADVRSGLDGLREFVGHLEKGERARDLLTNTERGAEIKKKVAEFVHKAKGFIRRYKAPVFIKNEATGSYSVNPKLLGTTGGAGNSKVAVVVNHMLSIVVNGLKSVAAQPGTGEAGTAENAEDINVSELFDGGYELLPQDTP